MEFVVGHMPDKSFVMFIISCAANAVDTLLAETKLSSYKANYYLMKCLTLAEISYHGDDSCVIGIRLGDNKT